MEGSKDERSLAAEEFLEHKRALDHAKNYVKNSVNGVNKKGLKGLEALLYVLSDLSKYAYLDKMDERYIREEMKNLDYKLKDVEDFASDERIYDNSNQTDTLGIFISAAINNVIKRGEKVHINSSKPINNLFYRLKSAEGHVNIAGDYLGKNAINSTIYAKKAGNNAGEETVNSEMHIYASGNYLGNKNFASRIYVYEAGDYLGNASFMSMIYAKKAGNNAGNGAYHSMLYIDKAGNMFAYSAKRSEIHFGEVGDGAAKYMSGCNVYGRKAGKDFGENAFKSNMYVDELGNNPGLGMQYSELHFKKLDGKLGSWDVDVKANNKVYKNGLPYILPNIKHAAKVMTYWTKGGISNLGGSIINNSRSILGVAQITVGALAIEEGVPYVYLRMPGYLYALPFVALLGGYSFYRGIYNVLKDN